MQYNRHRIFLLYRFCRLYEQKNYFHFPNSHQLSMIENDWINRAEQIRLRLTQLKDSL
ncbi:MAG: hypothetical protein LBU34_04920 [Planctomycetaceae bacterium]|jgi:hypothetical protein|nr:hypothetical protein [Planctomycetaceae bacterium]